MITVPIYFSGPMSVATVLIIVWDSYKPCFLTSGIHDRDLHQKHLNLQIAYQFLGTSVFQLNGYRRILHCAHGIYSTPWSCLFLRGSIINDVD
ncbi:hypothetical protein CS542_06590 [Pedobacter sp. IW39]|nr:hypothetical protein CS542_06590 [Pedobacter sp. IW39]